MTHALPEVTATELPGEPWSERAFTRFATALDTAVVRAMQLVIDATLAPTHADLPELQRSAAPYLTTELCREPRRFFDFLDEPVPGVAPTGRYRRSITGGVVIARRFPSAYRRFHGDAPVPPENAVVPVEHWMHEPGRPRATVLAAHGFTMGQPRLDAYVLSAAHWFRHGLDVALVTLPYHGARAPRGSRFSGEAFATRDLGQINEAIRQAVQDLHQVRTWLRRETRAPVGVLGLSLGGYLAALMAGLQDDLDFVVTMLPPVCMADLARRFLRAGSAIGLEDLRAAYRVHSPLTYPLRTPRERVLIIAGRGDRIVPPEHPHALWRHWGEPAIHWFGGGHLAPFGRRRIVRTVLAHLQSLDIL